MSGVLGQGAWLHSWPARTWCLSGDPHVAMPSVASRAWWHNLVQAWAVPASVSAEGRVPQGAVPGIWDLFPAFSHTVLTVPETAAGSCMGSPPHSPAWACGP